MSFRTSRWALLLLALGSLVSACEGGARSPGDGSADPSAEIPAVLAPEPTRVPFVPFYENVFIRVNVEGIGTMLFLYDTGSPGILLDEREAKKLGVESGRFPLWMDALYLGERRITLGKTLVGGETLPDLPNEPIRGYAGSALFEGFSVGLNFRDHELLLTPAAPPEAFPRAPEGVAPEATVVPFDLVKGYVAIPCRFSRGEADQRCLFDTGAMTSLTIERHWKTEPHPRSETLPQNAIDSAGTVLAAYFQRDEATKIGRFSVAGDVIKVAAEFDLLDSVGARLGLDLVGLVGVLTFKSLFLTIDYPNERLIFRRHEDLAWAPPSPFVGYGFLLDPDSLRVRYVAPGTDAIAAGVEVNDKVTEVNGTSTALASPELTLAQAVVGASGERASFKLRRGGATISVTLTAADLLPPP